MLGSSSNRNAARPEGSDEMEQLQTVLGNRRAYEFTVMPLADVTQAFDEGEAARAIIRDGLRTVESDASREGMAIDEVAEAVRNPYEVIGGNILTYILACH